MVGWYHRLSGHEFEQTPGVSEGQGSLACFDSWDHKESDMTDSWCTLLRWTQHCKATILQLQKEKNHYFLFFFPLWLHHPVCAVLVPWPWIEPRPSAMKAWSPNHWTARKFPITSNLDLEKEMAAHFSILAWKIPWTEEPGRLQSMGSQRVGHDWAT